MDWRYIHSSLTHDPAGRVLLGDGCFRGCPVCAHLLLEYTYIVSTPSPARFKSRIAGRGRRPMDSSMDEWIKKTPNPISRLFFKIDLFPELAALCLTDFIDWRYIHSLFGIFDPACELLAPWAKGIILLYCCSSIFSLTSHPLPPLPKLNVQYIQTVYVWGGGGGWMCWRPYSAGILHSVSDRIQNLPNCFTTPNKMTSENDIKGLVSLKFLRPCSTLSWTSSHLCAVTLLLSEPQSRYTQYECGCMQPLLCLKQ